MDKATIETLITVCFFGIMTTVCVTLLLLGSWWLWDRWADALLAFSDGVRGALAALEDRRLAWLERGDHSVELECDDAPEPVVSLADTDALEPRSEPPVRGGSEPLPNHPEPVSELDRTFAPAHFADGEIVKVLATLTKPDSTWRFSANQIVDLVGGTRGDVLKQVSAARAPYIPTAPEPDRLRVGDSYALTR